MQEPIFPRGPGPNLEPSDLAFVSFDDKNAVLGDLPLWFRQWADRKRTDEYVKELYSLYSHPVLKEFTEELFRRAAPVGVLRSSKTTLFESNMIWLVLQDCKSLSKNVCLDDLLSARVGEFFYLLTPLFGAGNEALEMNLFAMDEDKVDLSLLNGFFLTFNGLSDTIPFLGGDRFKESPVPIEDETIMSRVYIQREWTGSCYIHTRRNCEYLILNPKGKVGFIPFTFEGGELIETYANTFAEAILKWVKEPRVA